MSLSALDWILVAATSLGSAALFAVLMVRRRWRDFPVFTAYMAFDTVLEPLLFAIVWMGSQRWYEMVYWASVLIEFVLQLGVIWEIVRIVMRPTGTWVRDAKKQFIFWGVAGIL